MADRSFSDRLAVALTALSDPAAGIRLRELQQEEAAIEAAAADLGVSPALIRTGTTGFKLEPAGAKTEREGREQTQKLIATAIDLAQRLEPVTPEVADDPRAWEVYNTTFRQSTEDKAAAWGRKSGLDTQATEMLEQAAATGDVSRVIQAAAHADAMQNQIPAHFPEIRQGFSDKVRGQAERYTERATARAYINELGQGRMPEHNPTPLLRNVVDRMEIDAARQAYMDRAQEARSLLQTAAPEFINDPQQRALVEGVRKAEENGTPLTTQQLEGLWALAPSAKTIADQAEQGRRLAEETASMQAAVAPIADDIDMPEPLRAAALKVKDAASFSGFVSSLSNYMASGGALSLRQVANLTATLAKVPQAEGVVQKLGEAASPLLMVATPENRQDYYAAQAMAEMPSLAAAAEALKQGPLVFPFKGQAGAHPQRKSWPTFLDENVVGVFPALYQVQGRISKDMIEALDAQLQETNTRLLQAQSLGAVDAVGALSAHLDSLKAQKEALAREGFSPASRIEITPLIARLAAVAAEDDSEKAGALLVAGLTDLPFAEQIQQGVNAENLIPETLGWDSVMDMPARIAYATRFYAARLGGVPGGGGTLTERTAAAATIGTVGEALIDWTSQLAPVIPDEGEWRKLWDRRITVPDSESLGFQQSAALVMLTQAAARSGGVPRP